MRVLMCTNTYPPHVGGVARATQSTVEGLRALGHDVRVFAPDFREVIQDPSYVTRLPALTGLGGAGFSAPLPSVGDWFTRLSARVFNPDVIHSHHPWLLGEHALSLRARLRVPVVFTWHTMYGEYAQQFSLGQWTTAAGAAAERLAARYANRCDLVLAPSRGVADKLRKDGVLTPIRVLPTGIDPAAFCGDRARARAVLGVSKHFVLGHVGRLSREKNLGALAAALRAYLAQATDARIVLVGDGAERAALLAQLPADRTRYLGTLQGQPLANAYAAMDVFVFASQSETQGLVLAEALLSNVPVAALSATGVDDVVQDGVNGALAHTARELPAAIARARTLDRQRLAASVQPFTRAVTLQNLLAAYNDAGRCFYARGAATCSSAH